MWWASAGEGVDVDREGGREGGKKRTESLPLYARTGQKKYSECVFQKEYADKKRGCRISEFLVCFSTGIFSVWNFFFRRAGISCCRKHHAMHKLHGVPDGLKISGAPSSKLTVRDAQQCAVSLF